MTPGQTRVLVLLAVLLGLEMALSPNVRNVVAGAFGGKQAGNNIPPDQMAAAAFGYGVGGLAVFGLAAVAPRVATGIVLLLIALVLLSNGGPVSGFLGQIDRGITLLNQSKQGTNL